MIRLADALPSLDKGARSNCLGVAEMRLLRTCASSVSYYFDWEKEIKTHCYGGRSDESFGAGGDL